jgi:hypothetical protein
VGAEDNAYGERIFFWVDEDGVRCGPRHRTLKAALSYYKDQNSRWVREEGSNRPQLVDYDRSQFPSQKKPRRLRVGEYAERDLSADEQSKVDQIMSLMEGGFV